MNIVQMVLVAITTTALVEDIEQHSWNTAADYRPIFGTPSLVSHLGFKSCLDEFIV